MFKKFRFIGAGIVLIVIGYLPFNADQEHLWVGKIITMDQSHPIAEAMLVRGDSIVFVGNESEARSLAAESVEVVNLAGKVIIPGFVAAHEHPTVSAVFRGLVDLSALTHTDVESAKQQLVDAIAQAEAGEFIFGIGIDPILMPELMLSRDQLDELAPENPVVLISQFLHSFWVNSLAMEAVGIDETSVPQALEHFYERDENGRLTGHLIEAAGHSYVESLKSPMDVAFKLVDQLEAYRSSGITTVASLGYNAPIWLQRWAGMSWDSPIVRQVVYLTKDELDLLPSSPDNGSEAFRVAGLKLWYDGSPYSGTMYLDDAYLDSALVQQLGFGHSHTGSALIERAEFMRLIEQFDSEGWQIAIHSQGDAASEEVIQMLDEIGTQIRLRHRLEHGLLLPISQLPTMAEQQISISYHINHLLYYGNALEDSFIGERSQDLLPLQTTLDSGVKLSLHADSPMFPADPISLMRTAILRESREGRVFSPEEALTVDQALRAMTIDAAWQLDMDHQVGSLSAGKLADFVILSEDLYQVPVREWLRIKVLETWLGGTPFDQQN